MQLDEVPHKLCQSHSWIPVAGWVEMKWAASPQHKHVIAIASEDINV